MLVLEINTSLTRIRSITRADFLVIEVVVGEPVSLFFILTEQPASQLSL